MPAAAPCASTATASSSTPACASISAASARDTPPSARPSRSRRPGRVSSTRAATSRRVAAAGPSASRRETACSRSSSPAARSRPRAATGARWRRGGRALHHLIDPEHGRRLRLRRAAHHRRRHGRSRRRGACDVALPRGNGCCGGSSRRRRRSRRARRRGRPDAARRGARVKTDPTFWLLARASGLTAYVLLTTTVLAGLVLKSRPFGRAVKAARVDRRAPLPDVSRARRARAPRRRARARSTVHMSPAALVVPGAVDLPADRGRASASSPASSRVLDRRLVLASAAGSVRNWRRLHWLTYGVFAFATVHGIAAGTDSSQPWAFGLYLGAVGAVVFAAAGGRSAAPRARPQSLHS